LATHTVRHCMQCTQERGWVKIGCWQEDRRSPPWELGRRSLSLAGISTTAVPRPLYIRRHRVSAGGLAYYEGERMCLSAQWQPHVGLVRIIEKTRRATSELRGYIVVQAHILPRTVQYIRGHGRRLDDQPPDCSGCIISTNRRCVGSRRSLDNGCPHAGEREAMPPSLLQDRGEFTVEALAWPSCMGHHRTWWPWANPARGLPMLYP